MSESLQALLSELERFGEEDDDATADRRQRDRPAPGGDEPFVALVRVDAAFTTSVVPVGKGEFLAVNSR